MGEPDKVVLVPAEDGSGVGAALIAALTLERGQSWGSWWEFETQEVCCRLGSRVST